MSKPNREGKQRVTLVSKKDLIRETFRCGGSGNASRWGSKATSSLCCI